MLHLASSPLAAGRLVRRAVPLVFVAFGLLAGACGENAGPPPPPADSGPRDLGVDLGRDQGSMDLGPDGAGGDQGAMDAGPDGGTQLNCEVEAPEVLGAESASVTQRLAIAHRVNDFAILFRERRPTFDDIWVRVYRDTPTGVMASADLPITTDAGGLSVSGVSRDPAIVATDAGYLAAWIDSREMGFEMWTRALDPDGVPGSALQRVTTSTGAAASPTLTRGSNGTFLAGHIHDDTQTGTTRSFNVATVGATGALTGSWTRVSDMAELTSQGALVPGQAGGFLSGWLDASSNVRVRTISASGAPTGTAVTHLSVASYGLDPFVLVFARNEGFDAIRAQAISASGSTDGLLRSATPPDATGRDPGVAPLLGGVVIAYRHTTTSGPNIALALVNSRGELRQTVVLGATTDDGGPVSVAVNNEGRIRLAWAEIEAGTTTTYTQAVVCAEPL